MTRWGIAIDDSAGRPLAHTAAGSFPVPAGGSRRRPVCAGAAPGAAQASFRAARAGSRRFRARARELDRWCLRGPRPDAGLAGIDKAIDSVRANARNRDIAEPLARLRSGGARSPPSWRRWNRCSHAKMWRSAPCSRRMSRRRKHWPVTRHKTACCGPAGWRTGGELCAALNQDSRGPAANRARLLRRRCSAVWP